MKKKRKQCGKMLMLLVFVLSLGILSYMTIYAAAPGINRTKAVVIKGGKMTLTVKNNKKKIKWTSSNKKVAAVAVKGNKAIVTGKKPGKATISGLVGKKAYKCFVTVKNAGLSRTSLSLKKGASATIRMRGYTKTKWSSSNPKVAAITKKTGTYAKVKGLKAGTAVIRAKAGKKTYRCRVTVKAAGKSGTGNTEKHKGLKSFKAGQKFDAKNAVSAKLPYYIKDIEFLMIPMHGRSVEELKKDYEEIIRPHFNIPESAVPYNAIRYTIVNNSDIWITDPYCSLLNTTTYQIDGDGRGNKSRAHDFVTNGEVYVTYGDLEFPKEYVKPGTSKTFIKDAVLGCAPNSDPECTVRSTCTYGILKDNASFQGELRSGTNPIKDTSDKTPYIYFKFTLKDMKGTYKIIAIKGN